MSDIHYTTYFDSCKGVFQGGGCKAIVYIGAFKEAYKRGVFFSELAGTSAGSIIAALIAAGATADYLEKKVRSTEFSRFVKDYKKSGLLWRWLLKLNLPKGMKDKAKYLNLTSLRKNYGIFDSKKIESYVEECLHELTGKTNIVTFNDLIPDLHVVCADLENHCVKIWNKQNTPNDSVAKAVSSSCAIPIFFQPVDQRYVDGGILSNLPNFIFSEEPHYNRILCFRNQSSRSNGHIKDIKGYANSVIGTITEGADGIQQMLNWESYDVPIMVDEITSTDFDKINGAMISLLISRGEQAMGSFLDDETTFITSPKSGNSNILENEEKVHSMVSYISMENHKEVCVSSDDTYWAWNLFLSIVRWINGGATVNIFASATINEKFRAEELARRRMLKAMGCNVIELSHQTVRGFFFNSRGKWSGIVYDKNSESFIGKYYNSNLDSPLIKEWVLKYKRELPETSKSKQKPINIKAIADEQLFNLLRNEQTYTNANLSFQTIELKDILFLNPYIRALKYKQIEALFTLYGDQISRFGAATLIFPNGKESMIGPPLVEEHNGKYYLIEGNTRCVYAYRHGLKKLKMVVASGVQQPLPCQSDETYTISEVLISDKKLKGSARYADFDYALFRHIEASIRPYDTYML